MPSPKADAAVVTMTDSQKCPLSSTFVDSKNNPATAPTGATVAFVSSNEAVITITAGPDANSCVVVSAGPLDSATVTETVTAADGSIFASGSIGFTIVSGAPVSVVITPGTPVEQ